MRFTPEPCWLKSSFSDAGGNNCVEVAATSDGVALRESENPGHVLLTSRRTLGSFIRTVKAGALTPPSS